MANALPFEVTARSADSYRPPPCLFIVLTMSVTSSARPSRLSFGAQSGDAHDITSGRFLLSMAAFSWGASTVEESWTIVTSTPFAAAQSITYFFWSSSAAGVKLVLIQTVILGFGPDGAWVGAGCAAVAAGCVVGAACAAVAAACGVAAGCVVAAGAQAASRPRMVIRTHDLSERVIRVFSLKAH